MARPPKKKDAEDFSNSILSKLTEEFTQKTAGEEFANDVTILFCGPKKSGKTSLVDRFINPTKDEKDQPKPTVALDYKFARYAATEGSSKVLAHIYDLGGDEANENLIGSPISTSTVGNMVLAITLDLSEPHNCIQSLEKWLQLLRFQVDKSLQALAQENPKGILQLEAQRALRANSSAEHADRGIINLFPVPLVIFGAKWDVLATDADPEKRKTLCRALRHFALANGAHLVLTSLKDKTSMNAMRSILRQLLFAVPPKGSLEQLDHSKPICVPAGKDSVSAIGLPASGQANERAWKEYVQHLFPDPSPSSKGGKKSEADQVMEELFKYPESSIDGMVEQRVEELQQYRRQVQRNQRLASEGIEGNKVSAVSVAA